MSENMTGFDSLSRRKKPYLAPSHDTAIPRHFLGQPGSDSLLPRQKKYLMDGGKRSFRRESPAPDSGEIPEWVVYPQGSRRHAKLHLFSRKKSIT